ncbi:MAG TPA: phosphoenolpyruvate--protein phosphotransferase [Gammaproteobacteria bacterium]|nr:phosphoenolpyruvate--protein phosphotransferase [Gammaproteobacteria bacterium]
MAVQLSGIGVSRGVAIAEAHILQRDALEVLEYSVPDDLVAEEVDRFEQAVAIAKSQLRGIRQRIPKGTRADIASFIDTHLLMLEDSTITKAPVELIQAQGCNAEWALKLQRDALVQVFDQMNDPYLRTRRDDVDHVVTRIQRILLKRDESQDGDVDDELRGRILIADDLTPADTVLMQHQGIMAFVTEYGGPLSHTAILARSLGIPAVVGARNVRRYLKDGELLIVDGQQGVILAGADQAILRHYHDRQHEERRYQRGLSRLKGKPAVTRDGQIVHLRANIELPEDVSAVRQVKAEGVGLYRTEFLFMNRVDTPDEDEQLQRYLEVVKALKGLPLTIRSLDLGADKEVDGSRPVGRLCTNPALGLRAIRLCLKDPTLFRPQLRAILRAAAHGPIRLMIPMLSNSQELFQMLALVEETKRELAREGRAFDPKLPVGGMIEVPAAALSAGFFARHLDFLSIGTNDLIQYTLAIDRIDDEVNYLYDPLHPAVLRLVQMVIDAGHKAGIPVSMCGEMAGDARYTRLLLGLGLTEFSMQAASVLEIKGIINDSEVEPLARLARRLVRSQDPQEAARLFATINAED